MDTPRKLKDLRVTDLKAELEKRQLATSGVKAVLVDRLATKLEEEGHNPSEFVFGAEEQTEEGAQDDKDTEMEEEKKDDDKPVDEQGNTEKEDVAEVPKVVVVEEEEEELEDPASVEDVPEKVEESKEEVETEVHTNGNETSSSHAQEEDSINLMIGDEDVNFGEDEENKVGPGRSPPRPETAPVVTPFTSRDTINMASRANKAYSENSSMLVNPDESESVGTQESGEKEGSKEKTAKDGEGASNDTVAKSGEEKKPSCSGKNLWVSGLSSSTRATDLKTTFSNHGKVIGAKVVTNSRTPGARCFGYVTMNSPEEAQTCIEKLNKTELHSRTILVELAKGDSGPPRNKADEGSRDKSKAKDGSSVRECSSKDGKEGSSNKSQDRGDSSKRDRDARAEQAQRRVDNRRRRGAGRNSRSPTSRDRYANHPIPKKDMSPRREDKATRPGVLTFQQIREEREKEKAAREEERRRRERDRRRRQEEDDRRRDMERRRRHEEEKIQREREELRKERERLEREKQELMKFERERQRLERERLQREKEELELLRRQQSRMDLGRSSLKRPSNDRGHDFYNKRSNVEHHSGGGGHGGRGGYDNSRGGARGYGASVRDSRDMRDNRESRNDTRSRDVRDTRDSRDTRDNRDSHDNRGRTSTGGTSTYDNRSTNRYDSTASLSNRRSGNDNYSSGRGGSDRDHRGGGSSSSSTHRGPGGYQGGRSAGSSSWQAGTSGANSWGNNSGSRGGVPRPPILSGGNSSSGLPSLVQPFSGSGSGYQGGSSYGGGASSGAGGGSSSGDRFDAYKNPMMGSKRY